MSTVVPTPNPARKHPDSTLGSSYEYTSVPLDSVMYPSEDGSPKPWRKGDQGKPFIAPGPTASTTRPDHMGGHRWSSSSASRPQNLRRFGLAWWKYHVKVQMNRKRLPRLLYGLSGLILLVIWLGIATSFAATLQSAEAANRIVSTNGGKPPPSIDQNALLLFLSGQISSFDPSKRTLSKSLLSAERAIR